MKLWPAAFRCYTSLELRKMFLNIHLVLGIQKLVTNLLRSSLVGLFLHLNLTVQIYEGRAALSRGQNCHCRQYNFPHAKLLIDRRIVLSPNCLSVKDD